MNKFQIITCIDQQFGIGNNGKLPWAEQTFDEEKYNKLKSQEQSSFSDNNFVNLSNSTMFPADMDFFKNITKTKIPGSNEENVVIMGYNTWKSMGKKSLIGRHNCIITSMSQSQFLRTSPRKKNRRKTWPTKKLFDSHKDLPFPDIFNSFDSAIEYYLPTFDNTTSSLEQSSNPNKQRNVFVIGGGIIYNQAINHKKCGDMYITKIGFNFQADTFFPMNEIDMTKYTVSTIGKSLQKINNVMINDINTHERICSFFRKPLGKMHFSLNMSPLQERRSIIDGVCSTRNSANKQSSSSQIPTTAGSGLNVIISDLNLEVPPRDNNTVPSNKDSHIESLIRSETQTVSGIESLIRSETISPKSRISFGDSGSDEIWIENVNEYDYVYEDTVVEYNIEVKIQKYTRTPQIEEQYLSILEEILLNGDERETRNGVTLSIFDIKLKCDLRDGFPLLTTKSVPFRWVKEESLMFDRGHTNTKVLESSGINIWKGNTTREFLDSRRLLHLPEGDMGPMYGFQTRHYGADYDTCDQDYTGIGFDQYQHVIRLLNEDPHNRRIMMTTFNPDEVSKSVLAPCHSIIIQFYVKLYPVGSSTTRGLLSCKMYQRSADMFLGVPFNIASTALLVHKFGKICNLTPHNMIITIGDAHIYQNHINAVETQLERTPFELCNLTVSDNITSLDALEKSCSDDYVVCNYKCHKKISAPMSA
ncbi:MAG: thymidylate synthase [Colwellia sp.]|nr:thymidylate synthase [Colwellia sp.]